MEYFKKKYRRLVSRVGITILSVMAILSLGAYLLFGEDASAQDKAEMIVCILTVVIVFSAILLLFLLLVTAVYGRTKKKIRKLPMEEQQGLSQLLESKSTICNCLFSKKYLYNVGGMKLTAMPFDQIQSYKLDESIARTLYYIPCGKTYYIEINMKGNKPLWYHIILTGRQHRTEYDEFCKQMEIYCPEIKHTQFVSKEGFF